jgi:DHA2 family multidrug resistance protein
LNLEVSPWQIVWPRVALIAGLSMTFAPLNVAAYLYTPRHLRGAAVGLFALLRNEGGSVGTSVAQTIQERREIFHELRLNEHLDPYNPVLTEFAQNSQAALERVTGDPAAAKSMSLQVLDNLRLQQASSLAYFDVFWVVGVISFVLVFLVLFMKPSAAEKGAHVGAE